MGNRAVIIGATGAVGREILKEVLAQDFYTKVYVLGRNSINKIADNSKLEKIVVDFDNLDFDENILNDADIFAALGTTIKVAKTKENQKKIDLDYTLNFAKLCEGKIRSFNVVSSLGARSESKAFYTSLKGKLEDGLKEMNIGILRIYRPSLLLAKRSERRIMEEIFIKISPLFTLLLRGKLKKYSPIEVSLLGREMVRFAKENKKSAVYTYNDFVDSTL